MGGMGEPRLRTFTLGGSQVNEQVIVFLDLASRSYS